VEERHFDQDWRASIRTYLAEHVGTPIRLGEYLARFIPVVPLHHATRYWETQRRRNGARVRKSVTPDEMRESAVRHELNYYYVEYHFERTHGSPMPTSGTFTPRQRQCLGCGMLFFGRKNSKHHSSACASITGKDRARENRLREGKPPQVMYLMSRIDRTIESLQKIRAAIEGIDWPEEYRRRLLEAAE
jgi:hypothetical protein